MMYEEVRNTQNFYEINTISKKNLESNACQKNCYVFNENFKEEKADDEKIVKLDHC